MPLRTSFTVTEWEASYGDQTISGGPHDLDKITEFISTLEPGGQLIITGKSLGEDEKERPFGGVWMIVE